MIAIIDYGMGNLRSVQKAFVRVGADAEITSDPVRVQSADGIVLPGVGAFGLAMENLRTAGLDRAICSYVAAGGPFLGICLGLQLMFDESEELGTHEGLHLLPGRVKKFPVGLKVPHVGWNQLNIKRSSVLLEGVVPGDFVYFVHSFYVEAVEQSDVVADTDYGQTFCSVAERGNIMGAQFHPEKSQAVGLNMLANFHAFVTRLQKERGRAAA